MYLLYDDRDGYSIRPDTPEQRAIYNYVRQLAMMPPEEAVDAFYRLLWQGNAYPRDDVKMALQKMVSAKDFEEHKLKIINRCYYTLVNRWHLDGSRDDALVNMILKLETMPSERAQNTVTRSLRDTLRSYKDSDYYTVLKKNLYLLDGWESRIANQPRDRYFGDLFSNYFFIYEAGTQTVDIEKSGDKLSDGILQKRDQKLRQYRQDLANFYTCVKQPGTKSIPNPTQQLTSDDLYQAIKLYTPRRQDSFKLQADGFKGKLKPLYTVGECKRVIYHHVMQPLQELGPSNQRLFSREFAKVLDEFQDDLSMTRTIEIQIFSRLLSAIARYDDTRQEEARFYRFVTVAGPQVITSLLLKIILTCRMVRFELEKRFAYLHHKFSSTSQDVVRWLVEAFDHMNVALALNAKYLNYFALSSQKDSTIPDSV